MVSLYAEEVSSSINSIDYLLIDFRDEWDGDTDSFEDLVQRRRPYVDPEMGYSVSIIDQQGHLVFTTVSGATLPINLGDRESYQHHLHDPTDAPYVGPPEKLRLKSLWSIPFTRPLFSKDGEFNGLIVITVLPSYFSRFHQRVDLGKDSSIFLGRANGQALARHPRPELAQDTVVRNVPWVEAAPSQKGMYQKHSDFDQIERLFAWQTLDRGNLVVVMGNSMATILAPYHHQRTVYLASGTAATLLLLFAAYLWGRYQRHRHHAAAEMRKMESALAHSQKLEAIGKLTGGVTHDFNHVLQIITSNLQLLQQSGAAGPGIEPHLRSIATATERGTKLAAQLLTFARRQPLHPTAVDVAKLLARIDHLMQQLVGPDMKLQMQAVQQSWIVKVDCGLLERVFFNLAANARDAMNGQGVLHISVNNQHIGPDQIRHCPEIAQGDYVLLVMKDAGCGMPPEVMEHAFEPFFTTKPEGKGTGLGLAMAYGFIKQSGGHIRIESAPGEGTMIQIYLPRSREQENALPAVALPAPATSMAGGSETILFVEDSAELRTMMGMMLENLGYRVLRASNARDALRILEKGDPVDMLFTDIRLPGSVNGIELARQARVIRPDLKVLLASGADEVEPLSGNVAEVSGFPFLSKPYTLQDADAMLRGLLSRKEGDFPDA